jgi:hypothetical protein
LENRVKRIKRQRCLRRIDSFRRGTNQSRSAPNEGKLLIETVVAGETISKEKLTSSNKKLHHPQNGSDSKSIQRTQHYFDR